MTLELAVVVPAADLEYVLGAFEDLVPTSPAIVWLLERRRRGGRPCFWVAEDLCSRKPTLTSSTTDQPPSGALLGSPRER